MTRPYPFWRIEDMRMYDPPNIGYYHYPATGEIVRVEK